MQAEERDPLDSAAQRLLLQTICQVLKPKQRQRILDLLGCDAPANVVSIRRPLVGRDAVRDAWIAERNRLVSQARKLVEG